MRVKRKHKGRPLTVSVGLLILIVQLLFEEFRIGYSSHRPYTFSSSPFSFSACLLMKDDNIILPEWLAYHYTFLPLQRLIVAVDPLSVTDPEPILNRYRSLGMDITIWRTDTQNYLRYSKTGKYAEDPQKKPNFNFNLGPDETYSFHLLRQRAFYGACLRTLKEEGRTWTAVVDTDEFINFNYYDKKEGTPSVCHGNSSCIETYQQSIQDGTHFRTKLNVSRTAAEHIEEGLDPLFHTPEKSCIVMPRYVFGSATSGDDIRIPPIFNVSYFHTIRYRHRTSLGQLQPGKSIVDASRYNGSVIKDPHRLYDGSACTGSNAYAHKSEMSFRVHHYVGTWESFRRPGSDAQSLRKFEQRNSMGYSEVDNVASMQKSLWLSEFVLRVGIKRAFDLTQQLRIEAEEEMGKFFD
mmetsp:Transcript_44856/g.94105  ORF Transcript_44856/g.94105 Transcript_44856/m.94105 type:complete len:408 (+) Transcript_44856:54-1277(+)